MPCKYNVQPRSNIIIVYFKHITHTLVIIKLYKGINHFDVLAQSVAAMTAVVVAPTVRWRSTVTGVAGSFNTTEHSRGDSVPR